MDLMHILFLTQIIPYPPDSGPKVKTWHVLRYLVEKGHRVTLASFVRPDEEAMLPVLQKLCNSVHTVPIRRSRIKDVLYWMRSQISGQPFLIERDNLAEMRMLIRRLSSECPFDAIHADQLTMAQFAFPKDPSGLSQNDQDKHPYKPATVFDAHNAVWTIVNRMGQNAAWFLKPVAMLEAERIKRYEGEIVVQFDHTLTVSEVDRQALLNAVEYLGHEKALVSDKMSVIPIAVDTINLQPVSLNSASRNILTLGTLHYPPNADGIRWFSHEIFPLIQKNHPQVTLTIIGKNPPPDFLELAAHSKGSILLTGYIPDLLPYLEQAAVLVVPVRAGGGMRVRILEAFSRGLPVVTTTVGLEGIDAVRGRDVLVEDDPLDFATAVGRLLNNAALRQQIAANGRSLVKQKYDWQVVLRQLDQVYASLKK